MNIQDQITLAKSDNHRIDHVASRHFLGCAATTYFVRSLDFPASATGLITIEHRDIEEPENPDYWTSDVIWYKGDSVFYDTGYIAAKSIALTARPAPTSLMQGTFCPELDVDLLTEYYVLGGAHEPIRRLHLAHLILCPWSYGWRAANDIARKVATIHESATKSPIVLNHVTGKYEGTKFVWNRRGIVHRLPVAPGKFLEVEFGRTVKCQFTFPRNRTVSVLTDLEVIIRSGREPNEMDFNVAWAFTEQLRSMAFAVDANFFVIAKTGRKREEVSMRHSLVQQYRPGNLIRDVLLGNSYQLREMTMFPADSFTHSSVQE